MEDLAKRILERQKEDIWKMALAFNDPKKLHELFFGKKKPDTDEMVKNLQRLGFVVKE